MKVSTGISASTPSNTPACDVGGCGGWLFSRTRADRLEARRAHNAHEALRPVSERPGEGALHDQHFYSVVRLAPQIGFRRTTNALHSSSWFGLEAISSSRLPLPGMERWRWLTGGI
jgi:hypothetical protein